MQNGIKYGCNDGLFSKGSKQIWKSARRQMKRLKREHDKKWKKQENKEHDDSDKNSRKRHNGTRVHLYE